MSMRPDTDRFQHPGSRCSLPQCRNAIAPKPRGRPAESPVCRNPQDSTRPWLLDGQPLDRRREDAQMAPTNGFVRLFVVRHEAFIS
jgi:hypothetical protein